MKPRAYRIVSTGVIATIFVLSMSMMAEADVTDGPAVISPCNYDPNPDWYLNFTTDVALGSTYKLYDWHGGTWCDAEKTADNAEDDLLCWAAAACNVMNWTGWGFVINGTQDITNEDEMFRYFQDH